MNGGFLCKVPSAHLAYLRCGNICTKVLGNWLPGSSPARGTGAGQASLSTADTSTQHSALQIPAGGRERCQSWRILATRQRVSHQSLPLCLPQTKYGLPFIQVSPALSFIYNDSDIIQLKVDERLFCF